ncbi:MAG: ABC transporter permease [Afipia sp.]|jgi:NitT/TauT family transport system permease protein|nr:ABC transporter permease [Afipia sp.]
MKLFSLILASMIVPAAASSRRHSWSVIPGPVVSTVSIIIIVLIWFVATNYGAVPAEYLPSPQALISRFWTLLREGYQGESLFGQIGASLSRTLSGFVIGGTLGVAVGLAAGYSRLVAAAISPVMSFIRPIPPIAFIPMVVLYFGLGETGKIVLITVTAFNYAVVNAQAGAMGTPIAYRRAAATLGLSKWQEFWNVIFPASLPSIFTGLRVALALSWAVVVAAELVGAQTGLGFMINNAALLFDIPTVFIGIALIGLIGLILNTIIEIVEKRVVHWKGRG